MVVLTAREHVGSRTPTGDLVEATHIVTNGAGGSLKCRVTLKSVSTLGRSICLILILIYASGPRATMEVKMWGLPCLRILLDKSDLTEAQFLAALDTDELGDMVGSIADDQVFVMQIRIFRSSFNGNWEGHVNHVTRAP